MNIELKKAIVNFMIDNEKEFQLVNATIDKFRQYTYTPEGEYCIGGTKVAEFIKNFDKLLKN